jgi:glycosyltransferase involved in cell wall biosynthesis
VADVLRSDARIVVLQSSHAAHHPRHHLRFAATLAAAGYDVRTMAQPDLGGGHRDAVPVDYLPRRRSRLTRMLSGPLTVARALRRRPDALHVVCLDLLPWAVLARRLRRGLVVLYDSNEEYDLYVAIKDWLPRPMRRTAARLVRVLEPRLSARLDAATTAVPATHEKFRAAGVRTLLVRNFPPAGGAADAPRRNSFEYDVLVGGSLPPPQFELLAETAAKLAASLDRPARWLVFARHFAAADELLLDEVLHAAGVREQFAIFHDRPFDEVRRAAARSAVAFAPYPGDEHYLVALPIRLFEYMAWEVPFVTSELPALTRLLDGESVGILARPGDTDGYAAALARLIVEPQLGRRLGANGRRLVASRLNWEQEGERLVSLYDDLLGVA